MKDEHFKINYVFTCQKKKPEPTQKIGSGSRSNLNWLRLQPKNLGSDRLCNTADYTPSLSQLLVEK